MNVEQFTKMTKDWEFGGREIVWGTGEFMVRRFAFSGKALASGQGANVEQTEVDEFVQITSDGLKMEGHEVTAEETESEVAASRTVTMFSGDPKQKKEACVLRLDFYAVGGKIII